MKKILYPDEAIHGIPSEEIYNDVLNLLRLSGETIHDVLGIKGIYEAYPHILHMGIHIGATSTLPSSVFPTYKWITLLEFLARAGQYCKEDLGELDWRDQLSQSFNEKINDYVEGNKDSTP